MFYFPACLTIFFFGMFILSASVISMHISGQVYLSSSWALRQWMYDRQAGLLLSSAELR
jgi:hypothetical protein